MIKWEYRVQTRKVNGGISKNLDEMTVEWLDEIGSDGWELVTITVLPVAMGQTSERVTLTFKRPVEE